MVNGRMVGEAAKAVDIYITGSADSYKCRLDLDESRFDFRLGNVFDSDIFLAVVACCAHRAGGLDGQVSMVYIYIYIQKMRGRRAKGCMQIRR